MLHGRDVEAGVQPRVSTGRSIHAVPSITPSPKEGIEVKPRLPTDPLGLSNWQMTQKTAFDPHNKTGSDVHIAASTDGWVTIFPMRTWSGDQSSR